MLGLFNRRANNEVEIVSVSEALAVYTGPTPPPEPRSPLRRSEIIRELHKVFPEMPLLSDDDKAELERLRGRLHRGEI